MSKDSSPRPVAGPIIACKEKSEVISLLRAVPSEVVNVRTMKPLELCLHSPKTTECPYRCLPFYSAARRGLVDLAAALERLRGTNFRGREEIFEALLKRFEADERV
ncbi:MAG: hypothetical protein ABSH49_10675 [Bryobacteraceae bacterium]|jgi:hypothetical protein